MNRLERISAILVKLQYLMFADKDEIIEPQELKTVIKELIRRIKIS